MVSSSRNETCFVHEYFGVDSKLVWEIVTGDVPEINLKLKKFSKS